MNYPKHGLKKFLLNETLKKRVMSEKKKHWASSFVHNMLKNAAKKVVFDVLVVMGLIVVEKIIRKKLVEEAANKN